MPVASRAGRFAVYGTVGVSTEVAFTSLTGWSPRRDARLLGRSSPWMFPIYGLLQPLFEPAHRAMRDRVSAPVRGFVYAAGFLTVEYASGWALRRLLGRAPWDYSHTRWNVDGLVRFDYALLWGLAGLAAERLHDALDPPPPNGEAPTPARRSRVRRRPCGGPRPPPRAPGC